MKRTLSSMTLGRASTRQRIKQLYGWISLVLAASLLLNACNVTPPAPAATPTPRRPVPITVLPPTANWTATPTISPTPTPVNNITLDPSELSGVKVRFWHAESGKAGLLVADAVQRFNQTNELGIQVQALYKGSPAELAGELQTRLDTASGPESELPEVAVVFPYQAQQWDTRKSRSALVDLAPYIEDATWGLSTEAQAGFYPAFWQTGTRSVDGRTRRFGMPAQGNVQVLYYNQTWAHELGFTSPPQAPQQFEQQACAAARANQEDDDPDNNGTGGYLLSPDYMTILGWLYGYGARLTSSQSNSSPANYSFENQKTEAAFTFLRQLLDAGCAWEGSNPAGESQFASRQALFMPASALRVDLQAQTMAQPGSSGDEWTVIAFPSPALQPATSASASVYVLFPTLPERQLAAWLFVRWMLEPENQLPFIQAQRSVPLSTAALEAFLDTQAKVSQPPQWKQALELLSQAQPEPGLASWGTVRWVLQDASTQLYRYYFEVDQMPSLLELLQQTATELNAGLPKDLVTPTRPAPFRTPEP